MVTSAAHGFGLVIHHVDVKTARAEPVVAGFAVAELFGTHGDRVLGDITAEQTSWFHVVARKAG